MKCRVSAAAIAMTVALVAPRATSGQQPAQTRRPDGLARVRQLLVDRALSGGRLRIIVGLDVPARPEGVLNAAERAQQRAAIVDAQSTVLDALAGVNLGQVKRFQIVPGLAIEADLTTLDFLRAHPRVAYIEEDVVEAPHLAQSATIIGAPGVWSAGYTGTGQTVAILDTGVDRDHPFFWGRVVSEACYSTTSNLHGGSTSTALCTPGSTATGSAAPCAGLCDHGTHVAGIAAGSGVLSGMAMHGVARDANIIAIQVFSRFDGPICGSTSPCVLTYTSDQIAALERVYALRTTLNIAAANMSLGGGQFFTQAACDSSNTTRKAAIDNLRSAGIATVVSSGNDGFTDSMSAPACISSAVSVGSTRDGGSSASAVPVASGSVASYQGTSMAAPQVAGAFALLRSRAPSATVSEIQNALTTTGLSVTDAKAPSVTKPRINVSRAANALGAGGWFEIRSDSAGNYGSLAWANVGWPAFTSGGGATFPAVGRPR